MPTAIVLPDDLKNTLPSALQLANSSTQTAPFKATCLRAYKSRPSFAPATGSVKIRTSSKESNKN